MVLNLRPADVLADTAGLSVLRRNFVRSRGYRLGAVWAPPLPQLRVLDLAESGFQYLLRLADTKM